MGSFCGTNCCCGCCTGITGLDCNGVSLLGGAGGAGGTDSTDGGVGIGVDVDLTGCVVFVEVGVVGISREVVVGVSEVWLWLSEDVTVDEEFSVVESVLSCEKAARRTQRIEAGGIFQFGMTAGTGNAVPNSV